jgi:hypothetical protein
MKQSPSNPANFSSDSQETPHYHLNPKAHYRVRKNPTTVPLSWATRMQSASSHAILLKSVLILYNRLCLSLTRGLFPSGFLTKTMYAFSYSQSRPHARPLHPLWLDHPNEIWREEQIMTLLIMQFYPASCYFILLRPIFLLRILFSNTLNLRSSLNAWDKIPYLHNKQKNHGF